MYAVGLIEEDLVNYGLSMSKRERELILIKVRDWFILKDSEREVLKLRILLDQVLDPEYEHCYLSLKTRGVPFQTE